MDGEVRLQDGTHPSNGRVEICQYGIWGSVCSNNWDHNDAVVVCRQLGYDSEGTQNMHMQAYITVYLVTELLYKCFIY